MDDDSTVIPGMIVPWIIIPSVAVLIVIVIFTVTFMGLNPWFLNKETQQIHASNGYIQGIQTELSTDELSYVQLNTEIAQDQNAPATIVALRAQQRALIGQMHIDAGKIPAQDIPADVKVLLAQQP